MLIAGVDEAGRGSVIGPLVIAGVLIREDNLPELVQLGVKDSKLLSPKRREMLYQKIRCVVQHFIVIKVSPNEIDAVVEAGKRLRRLNWLEAQKMGKIIQQLKTDVRYPIVSAASIIAKVERDNEIEDLRKLYGDFGSGYPSDQKTVNFLRMCLKNSGEYPAIVRKSWKTTKKLKTSSLL